MERNGDNKKYKTKQEGYEMQYNKYEMSHFILLFDPEAFHLVKAVKKKMYNHWLINPCDIPSHQQS